MFKNILVPTDGSTLSQSAAKYAVQLAKATGARITGFHVAPSYKFDIYEDYMPRNVVTLDQHAAKATQIAEQHLTAIRQLADAAGVAFSGEHALSDFPGQAIVKAAEKYECDGIVMGSHGRGGVSSLILGSQTQKVLASTKLPVMVVH